MQVNGHNDIACTHHEARAKDDLFDLFRVLVNLFRIHDEQQ